MEQNNGTSTRRSFEEGYIQIPWGSVGWGRRTQYRSEEEIKSQKKKKKSDRNYLKPDTMSGCKNPMEETSYNSQETMS